MVQPEGHCHHFPGHGKSLQTACYQQSKCPSFKEQSNKDVINRTGAVQSEKEVRGEEISKEMSRELWKWAWTVGPNQT